MPAVSLRTVVRTFTPNWFTVTMGTGVLALCLAQFPLQGPLLHTVAIALWLVNIGLFAVISSLYVAHWLLFPAEARRVFDHPVMSMFFGAIPMGLTTIVNGTLAFGPEVLGKTETAVRIATGLWWIDAALALLCGLVIPYFMFTRQDHRFERMTAVWLLPIVASEVAAASAGLLVPHLPPAEAYTVLLLGYVLWACSVPLAMSVLVLLFLRLVLHSLPEREMGVTGWLALGPIGTGALGLLVLGDDAPAVFAAQGLPEVGTVALGLGIIGGVVLWGYGLWWLALAAVKTLRYTREGLPFNLGWWGFTFPLGVYTLATLALGRMTHLPLFTMCGGLLVVCLALFWVLVASRTAAGTWSGRLFPAPTSEDIPMPMSAATVPESP